MILERKIYLMVTAAVLCFFIIIQMNSLDNVNASLQRDSKSNIFQEIKILKNKNEDLKTEIDEINDKIDQLNDQGKALSVIQDEINEYTKLDGKVSIFGAGISIQINGPITTPWMIDFVNEIYNAGAQAVSVNGIRITERTAGFDTLPKGQLLLNGSILSGPYSLEAIGDPSVLAGIAQSSGGIFERIKKAFPSTKITLDTKDVIQMN